MACLSLGDITPDFTADTGEGPISFQAWTKGAKALFFSHPGGFTPVCTTELGRVAQLADEWTKRGTKVIALSVDPVEEHHRWIPDVEEVSNTTLRYPIVAETGPYATPAEWRPGERAIVSLDLSGYETRARFPDVDVVKPYLRYTTPTA